MVIVIFDIAGMVTMLEICDRETQSPPSAAVFRPPVFHFWVQPSLVAERRVQYQGWIYYAMPRKIGLGNDCETKNSDPKSIRQFLIYHKKRGKIKQNYN